MGQVLYRKYRSKKLSEIIGQEHITSTLTQALKSGRIAHAYLFTGPRGVGKTSVARILAHEINGLPYTDDATHLDIIEIDAASNRRIDEIRDLRDKVYVAPTSATYKVYIIDEVHMLTREAFNALLKTLEEPPAHVVFILATTEAHKLPETIISRTQRYQFRPIEPAKVVAHLQAIAKQEHIAVNNDALQLIAEHGEGSFRDSISLLDQAAGRGSQVTLDLVQTMLGVPPAQAIQELGRQLQGTATIAELTSSLQQLFDQGYPAAAIAKQLALLIREQLVAGTYQGTGNPTDLLAKLLQVPASHDPARYLEIVLLEAVLPHAHATATVPRTVAAPPAPAVTPAATADKPTPKPEPAPAQPVKKPAQKTAKQPSAPTVAPYDDTTWQAILNSLKQRYNTLYSIARMASPRLLPDGTLELGLAFAFHQKRLNEAKNRQIISDAIVATTGQPMNIVCVLDESLKPGGSVQPATDPALSAISNIFGGGELLES